MTGCGAMWRYEIDDTHRKLTKGSCSRMVGGGAIRGAITSGSSAACVVAPARPLRDSSTGSSVGASASLSTDDEARLGATRRCRHSMQPTVPVSGSSCLT